MGSAGCTGATAIFGIEAFVFGPVHVAALVEEKPRQLQIPRFARGAIQPDQGQFDFLMPVNVVAFAGPENGVDVIGEPPGGVQHLGFPAQPVMLDGHLEEVPRVVHGVHQPQVAPALVLLLDDEVRDQEAVLLLRGQDAVENAVHAPPQGTIVAMLQRIQRAFEGLVQVRVRGRVSAGRALEQARRLVEVGDVPVLLQAV